MTAAQLNKSIKKDLNIVLQQNTLNFYILFCSAKNTLVVNCNKINFTALYNSSLHCAITEPTVLHWYNTPCRILIQLTFVHSNWSSRVVLETEINQSSEVQILNYIFFDYSFFRQNVRLIRVKIFDKNTPRAQSTFVSNVNIFLARGLSVQMTPKMMMILIMVLIKMVVLTGGYLHPTDLPIQRIVTQLHHTREFQPQPKRNTNTNTGKTLL